MEDSVTAVQRLLEGIGTAASRLAETDRYTYIDDISVGVGDTAAVIRYSNGSAVAIRVERIS